MIQLFLLFVLVLLSGCGLGPVKLKPVDYYTLHSVNITENYNKRGILAISMPKATRELETNSIIYTDRKFQISEYAYSKWTASPVNLLQGILLESFNKSGLFKAVISNSFEKSANWSLNVRILHWHQNFLESPSKVNISYIANIYDIKQQKIISSKIFETSVECPTQDAYGGVVATNIAISNLIPKTIGFVKIYTR